MITTVTLNPAVDRFLYVDAFQENKVNRVAAVKSFPGGKGINVSKVIRQLGAQVTAAGLLAGRNGGFIEQSLQELDIATDFLHIPGETRINTKIYDTAKGYTTDLNEPGPFIDEKPMSLLGRYIERLAGKSSTMVFSGSLPAGMPAETYRVLVEIANRQGCVTILDASGESLKEGLEAGPYLIKPNLHELEEIFGRRLADRADIAACSAELVKRGIHTTVVSMGPEGALMTGSDGSCFCECLPVEVKGTVGAGDSMVAAFAFAADRGDSMQDAFSLAMACSGACVQSGSTSEIDPCEIGHLQSRVRVSRL